MSTKKLIIVESPSKIKTLQKFLGQDYQIEASVGHIRDLPDKTLGIDLENNFKPTYVVSSTRSKQVVKHLKSVLKDIGSIYIATDLNNDFQILSANLSFNLLNTILLIF